MRPDDETRLVRIYRTLLTLLVQTIAAVLGLYIMFRAINEGSDRPWLYTAAIAMMGLPVAHNFEALVSFLGRVLGDVSKRTRDEIDAGQNEPPHQRRKEDP